MNNKNYRALKKSYVEGDRMYYPTFFSKEYFLDYLLSTEQYWLRSYIKALRLEEYYTYIRVNKILKYYYFRKKNVLGRKLGIFIPSGCFELGLHIAHYGSIIINPKARIGKNCTIHGNCCIGNKGNDDDGLPLIGNNVDIGQGAQILGNIEIADDVKIGAGSIVVHSIIEDGVSVVGIPAKVVIKK